MTEGTPSPPPKARHPPHGETEARARQELGKGHGEPGAARSQGCRHRGLVSILDTWIRTRAPCQHRGDTRHGDTRQPAQHRAPPGETEARGEGSHQGLLQAAAGRAHDLAQGAEGLAKEILPEPRCHRGLSPSPSPAPRCRGPGGVGGAVLAPHLRAWRGRGFWSPHRTWGQSRGPVAEAVRGVGTRWPWGQGWGRNANGGQGGAGMGHK